MPGKPRVLVLTPDFPPAPGGIQLLFHRLATSMSQFEPLVVAPGSEAAREFDRSSPVPVRRVKSFAFAHRATVVTLNAESLRSAVLFRPDVVLSAHIVTSPAASLIRKQLGAPVVQYVHANEVGARPRLAQFAMASADAVVAVSRHACDLARRVGAKEDILHRITPGVDLAPRQPLTRCSAPTIVTVSRLEDRYKGLDTVIRALPLVRASVGDVQWIVVGTGPRLSSLQRLADVYGIGPSTHFIGEVSDTERDAWLERAHVFTLPSRVPAGGLGGEGFGIVYLEAAWHELPVVAGNAGGALDAVVDGETGLLVNAEDPVAVADALSALLVDPELRHRLGSHGAERAREFGWPIIARQLEDVLQSVCERCGNGHLR